MGIQYLPWVLGIWRTVDKMNKTPALREVHPQHLANQQKSGLNLSERKAWTTSQKIQVWERERALPCKRRLTPDIPLRFPEPQFFIYNEHRMGCPSPVLAMIKWREISELILYAATLHANWSSTDLLYQLKLFIWLLKECFLSTYYVTCIWNTRMNKTRPLPSSRGDTHKTVGYTAVWWKQWWSHPREPWESRGGVLAPSSGEEDDGTLELNLKWHIGGSQMKRVGGEGDMLGKKVLRTEEWKPMTAQFHGSQALSIDRKWWKNSCLQERASGRPCLPWWCVGVYSLNNRETLQGFEQGRQSISSRF